MSKRIADFFLLLILSSSVCLAGTENNGRGTKSVGLATAFVAVADNPWAVYYNPAGLSLLPSFEVSLFFVPQQFGLSELQTVSAAAVVPTSFGTLAIGVSQFGFELYRETGISVGIGESIDWGVAGGLTANAYRLSFGDYGSTQTITLDLGLLAQLDEQVSLGFSFRNVLAATIGSHNERLPQVLSLGASYAPISIFFLTAELEKDVRYPAIIKAGAEQMFLDMLSLRVGVSNNPDKFSTGLSVYYSGFEFGYAGYSHPELGWTHQIELSFKLGS